MLGGAAAGFGIRVEIGAWLGSGPPSCPSWGWGGEKTAGPLLHGPLGKLDNAAEQLGLPLSGILRRLPLCPMPVHHIQEEFAQRLGVREG